MGEIVVGTDGSPSARHAVRWALGEARARGASLRIVHAWMVPLIEALPQAWAIGAPSLEPTDEDVHAHLEAAARSILDAAVSEARAQAPELDLVGELVEGRPTTVLLEAARDADLLVVGSRGHGGFAALLLGSVSSQCVHHAPCPVVVVPPRPAAA